MIQKVTVNAGQNIVDLVIQESGDIEGLIAMLLLNGLSVNSDPEVGSMIKTKSIVNQDVVKFLKDLKHCVSTGTFALPGNTRLLENGTIRLLEDGLTRFLE